MHVAQPGDENPVPTFGALLRRHRKAVGLTQDMLAERAGISVVTTGALERGIRRAPYRANVVALADALRLSAQERREFEAAAERSRGRRPRQADARPAVIGSLAHSPTSFIGRKDDIAELTRLLQKHQLLTIVGPGGVGKTRTAVELVKQLPVSPRDGVWFADLSAVGDPSAVVSKVISAIGERPVRHGDPLAGITQALRERHMLIIFDNCEHVRSEAKRVVTRILQECPAVTILATSRERLRSPGEVVYRLPVLDVPGYVKVLSAMQAQTYTAVALFIERATAVQQQFVLTDEGVDAVTDICRRLDGIPFAIEIAAGRLATLALLDLQRGLSDLLGKEPVEHNAAARQQTVRAMTEWSWRMLDEPDQVLFRRLAAFSDGWTLQSAEAVCSDDAALMQPTVMDRLSSLVDKSLVTVNFQTSQPRYRFLVLTREFAAQALEAAGERRQLAHRHLEYFRKLFEHAGADYARTYRQVVVTDLEVELTDARAAIEWGLANGESAAAAALFSATPLWYFCGLHDEEMALATVLSMALAHRDARLRALVNIRLSRAADDLGERAHALAAAREALASARESGDPLIVGMALGPYGYQLVLARRFDEARTAFVEAELALDEADRLGMTTILWRANVLQYRGHLARLEGDYKGAGQEYELQRTLCRSLGNTHNELLATINMSKCAFQCDELDRAISLIEEILPRAERVSRALQATILTFFAGFLAAKNDASASREMASNALRIVGATSAHKPLISIAIEAIALTLILDGTADQAAARLAGFSNALISTFDASREDVEQWNYQRLHELLNARFAPADLKLLLAMGSVLTPSEAFAEALAR